YAGGFGGGAYVEAVCLHAGAVVLLVGFSQFRGHGNLIVEVGKAAIRGQSAGIQDGLGGLLDFGFLGDCESWPGE
ncbi:MAG: hypothetical protein HFF17_15245, partial [Oscillospiraceae bacterium]|nr:hypothetical protein [Oscillospiraceae bacterium]